MTTEETAHIIEAILFVTGEAVELKALAKGLEFPELEIRQAVDYLAEDCAAHHRGIGVKRFGEHVQLITQTEYAPYIEKMLQPIQRQSLSQAALETLSIVAYRQPVTKLEIEAIRGVKCDYSIQSLTGKGLIREVGRKDAVGRPILYGTTDSFLAHFGLESLSGLPPMEQAQEEEDGGEDPLIP